MSDPPSVIGGAQGRKGQPSALALDGRTLHSTCKLAPHAGCDGCKRMSKMHKAIDTLGQLLTVNVTLVNE